MRARNLLSAVGDGLRRAGPGVRYGFAIPGRDEAEGGPTVKFQRLASAVPQSRRYDVVYLASGRLTPDARLLAGIARRRGARIVLNQNGVAYPAVYPARWRQINAPMARVMSDADHVFFQSEFCRLSAETFLGARAGPSEVLYNAVDTSLFTPEPASRSAARRLTLLLGGTQQAAYRVESALRATALVASEQDVELLVAGGLQWGDGDAANRAWAERLVKELGLAERVRFVGAYSQSDAPALYRSADILMHTQYNDACPGLVIEALSCGLPVVHSATGGVPELVGDAGVGVPAPLSWDVVHPPAPAGLAAGVTTVAARLDDFADIARRRAVDRFDIEPWIRRHREVFSGLRA
jgi:glycosyltransferase involved in cell wall biosynthesis